MKKQEPERPEERPEEPDRKEEPKGLSAIERVTETNLLNF